MRFNDLLRHSGIDPKECTLMLHTPKEPAFRRAIGQVFLSDRAVFERYQSSHHKPATATIRGRPYMASFLGLEGNDCVFVGLYDVGALETWSEERIFADREIGVLQRVFGLSYDDRLEQTFFDLSPREELRDFSERLVIAPRLTRAYVRLAENLDPEIVEFARESLLDRSPADWRKLVLSAEEIATLGPRMRAAIREWRGIYLIFDRSDGQRYVGAAYGETNLLGRWQAHVARETGVTSELSRRDSRNFHFSILERVSPDMPMEDVVALEQTWMRRLHTRGHGLNK